MWISNLAIKKPTITTVVALGLTLFGLISLFTLSTDEFPRVSPPVVSIAVAYPGASPPVVERELVDRMEDAFQAISGVDEVSSTAYDGYAIITVTFLFQRDIAQAEQDIRDKIGEIRNDLPPEMKEPILTRFSPDDLPVVSLTLVSPSMSQVQLTDLADPQLTRELRGIEGVADVSVQGGAARQLVVELRAQALAGSSVSIPQIVSAIEASNLAVPVGAIDGKDDERSIRLRGRVAGPTELGQIVVGKVGDRVVHLADVADVKDGSEEPRSSALYNDTAAVGLDIKKSPGYSTTDVCDRILARVAELQKTLPQGARLEVVRNAGDRVQRSVADVEHSLIEGAILTVLVVFVFLKSWRSTVITGLALPVSVIASFIAVRAFGFTLNTMSLLGLSLAIGILIDDAIVVRENIVRHARMGVDHVRAAAEGTSEIGLAVAATTFSIVVVFVPIAFMGGVAQQWFAPFALTIACSVLVSLFVSFSLDPMLSAIWKDPEVSGGKRSWLSRKLDWFEHGFDRLTGRYKRMIGWALRHRALMVLLALLAFAGAIAIPATGLVGSAFFPLQDRSEFTIHIDTPPGSNLAYTRQKALEAVAIARKHGEVAYTYTTVGGQGGTVDEADVYVRLQPRADRNATQDEVARAIRDELRAQSGVSTYILTGGFGNQRQIQMQLTGPDLDELDRLAAEIADRVRTVKGAVDVGLSNKGQRPELEVTPDRELSGTLGVTVAQLAQAMRPAFAPGVDAGDWVDPDGETRDVYVRLAPDARTRPADVAALPVPTAAGEVPLGQVAHVDEALGPAQIQHYNGERVITIEANTEDAPLSAVLAGIQRATADVTLPPGYRIHQGGEAKSQREVFGRILIALLTAVMLMYFILVVQFGSFLAPISIMASLPMSLIGVVLALLVTHGTLNLMSLIGVIMLMGIVAKNAILLVDFAKKAEARGLSREDALIEAGGVRLRPILMTSIAIIAGMLPVAIGTGEGGDFRAPLGRAVIGGVITSTLLTLLVIPTFYDILTTWRDKLVRRVKKLGHLGQR